MLHEMLSFLFSALASVMSNTELINNCNNNNCSNVLYLRGSECEIVQMTSHELCCHNINHGTVQHVPSSNTHDTANNFYKYLQNSSTKMLTIWAIVRLWDLIYTVLSFTILHALMYNITSSSVNKNHVNRPQQYSHETYIDKLETTHT